MTKILCTISYASEKHEVTHYLHGYCLCLPLLLNDDNTFNRLTKQAKHQDLMRLLKNTTHESCFQKQAQLKSKMNQAMKLTKHQQMLPIDTKFYERKLKNLRMSEDSDPPNS